MTPKAPEDFQMVPMQKILMQEINNPRTTLVKRTKLWKNSNEWENA